MVLKECSIAEAFKYGEIDQHFVWIQPVLCSAFDYNPAVLGLCEGKGCNKRHPPPPQSSFSCLFLQLHGVSQYCPAYNFRDDNKMCFKKYPYLVKVPPLPLLRKFQCEVILSFTKEIAP